VEHIAIDLGGRQSQVCVRAADGTIVEERRIPTAAVEAYLQRRPMSRVVVETCAESFLVADRARALGHEVRVVPATLVKSLGVGARRTKTDRRDAQVLSEVSCRVDLPSVHIPSQTARANKTLCGTRDVLVRMRTRLINTVRGWLRTQGTQLRSGATVSFARRVRDAYRDKAEQTLPECIERVLRMLEPLQAEIRAADREVKQAAKDDPRCRRMMTVPGVGAVTALRFVSALDEQKRFASAHAVQSYLGLVPGIHASSDKEHSLGLTKAGPPSVRWVLVQAAWAARRFAKTHPMVVWSYGVEHRRGVRIAIVALARKLAGILYALWRDETEYDPTRGARATVD
jgi:transposase